jgi:hypothetical protein
VGINSDRIRISVKLKNDMYLRLRDVGFKRRESHQEIAARAVEKEVQKLEKENPSKRNAG